MNHESPKAGVLEMWVATPRDHQQANLSSLTFRQRPPWTSGSLESKATV